LTGDSRMADPDATLPDDLIRQCSTAALADPVR
jgi:hypothetical protein